MKRRTRSKNVNYNECSNEELPEHLTIDSLLEERKKEKEVEEKRKKKIQKLKEEKDSDEENIDQIVSYLDKSTKNMTNKAQDSLSIIPFWKFEAEVIIDLKHPHNSIHFKMDKNENISQLFEDDLLYEYIKLLKKCDVMTSKFLFYKFAYSKYSREEELASRIFCNILQNTNEIKMEWLPHHDDVKDAILHLGYVDKNCVMVTSDDVIDVTYLPDEEEYLEFRFPKNLLSIIRILQYDIVIKNWSADDVASLVLMMCRFFLDVHMFPLTNEIQNCVRTLLDSLDQTKFDSIQMSIAQNIARASDKESNCVHILSLLPHSSKNCVVIKRIASFKLLLHFTNCKKNIWNKNFDFKHLLLSPQIVMDVSKGRKGKEKIKKEKEKGKGKGKEGDDNEEERTNEIEFGKFCLEILLVDFCMDGNLNEIDKIILQKWTTFLRNKANRISMISSHPLSSKARHYAFFFSQKYNYYLSINDLNSFELKMDMNGDCDDEEESNDNDKDKDGDNNKDGDKDNDNDDGDGDK